ncbi:15060_t:CDS:2 [Funneliformis geosporum]|nr:15060_t:CDS:2 [Funneliformis geosporum]
MGFKSNAQNCKNVSTLIQCEECDKNANSTNVQDSNSTNNSMKKLFSNVKVDNTLTCNSPIEVSYYSSELFKEALCFNCGLEYEEHINYDENIETN